MKVFKIHGKGNHLLLEGYGGSFDRLNNKELITNVLDELSEKLKMNKLSNPLVVEYKAKDEGGVTGIILLKESHIAIHTYPIKNFAVMDVFSCKEFDVEKTIEFFKEKFSFKEIKNKLIVREYERN